MSTKKSLEINRASTQLGTVNEVLIRIKLKKC